MYHSHHLMVHQDLLQERDNVQLRVVNYPFRKWQSHSRNFWQNKIFFLSKGDPLDIDSMFQIFWVLGICSAWWYQNATYDKSCNQFWLAKDFCWLWSGNLPTQFFFKAMVSKKTYAMINVTMIKLLLIIPWLRISYF